MSQGTQAIADHSNVDDDYELLYSCKATKQNFKVRVYGDYTDYYAVVTSLGDVISESVVARTPDEANTDEVERATFSAGRVADGGFNVRIFTKHPNPEVIRQGHLTIRHEDKLHNAALTCQAEEEEGDNTISVYSDSWYGGTKIILTEGEYNFWDFLEIGNDSISSIKIPSGMEVYACESVHAYGHCQLFTANQPELDNLNDEISYLKIQQKEPSYGWEQWQGESYGICKGKQAVIKLSGAELSLQDFRTESGENSFSCDM